MIHRIILGYKDLYNDQFNLDFVESLKGFNPNELIYLIVQLNSWIIEGKSDDFILNKILSPETRKKNRLRISRLFNLKKDGDIFHSKTCINFIVKIIENYSKIENLNYSDDEFSEINFLLNFLKLNETSFGTDDPFPKIEEEHFKEFAQLIFLGKTLNYDRRFDLYFELIKIKVLASYFFVNDKETFEEFCTQFKIINFDEWFLNLFSFLKHDYNEIFFFDLEENNIMKHFFDYQLLNEFEDGPLRDNQIQIKPIYKIGEKYLIIDKKHYFHNIYNLINYSFYELLKVKHKVNSYPHYKSDILSDKINEKTSFRFLMKELFGGSKYNIIKFFEFKASPDCYVRYTNSVYIIEFKDSATNDRTLSTYNYLTVKNKIDELLVRTYDKKGKEKKKGISQIVNFLNILSSSDDYNEKKDIKLDKKKLKIYPILILTDNFLSLPQVENYLTQEFKKQINKQNLIFKEINPLTVINLSVVIDFLAHNQNENFLSMIKSHTIRKKKFKKNANIFQDFPHFRYCSKGYESTNEGFLKKIFWQFKTTEDEKYLQQFFI